MYITTWCRVAAVLALQRDRQVKPDSDRYTTTPHPCTLRADDGVNIFHWRAATAASTSTAPRVAVARKGPPASPPLSNPPRPFPWTRLDAQRSVFSETKPHLPPRPQLTQAEHAALRSAAVLTNRCLLLACLLACCCLLLAGCCCCCRRPPCSTGPRFRTFSALLSRGRRLGNPCFFVVFFFFFCCFATGELAFWFFWLLSARGRGAPSAPDVLPFITTLQRSAASKTGCCMYHSLSYRCNSPLRP